MDDSVLKLENQLCFPLYAAAKAVTGKYKPFLDEIDLTYTQYIAMMVLWEKKRLSVREIGECLYLDSGTLTPLLKRLESKGYIKRERSAHDERSVIVALTAAGEAIKARAAGIPAKMGECINLSLEEVNVLYRLLHKLLGQM